MVINNKILILKLYNKESKSLNISEKKISLIFWLLITKYRQKEMEKLILMNLRECMKIKIIAYQIEEVLKTMLALINNSILILRAGKDKIQLRYLIKIYIEDILH